MIGGRPVVVSRDYLGRRFYAMVIAYCTTKKTSNKLICVERGARCRACNLPEREVCSACGRAKAGRHVVAPAENYRLWAKTAIPELRVAWGGRPPLTCEVELTGVFYRKTNVGDIGGYYQALCDVLQEAGVLKNDSQVKSADGTRLRKDPQNPRVELAITELAAEGELFEEEVTVEEARHA